MHVDRWWLKMGLRVFGILIPIVAYMVYIGPVGDLPYREVQKITAIPYVLAVLFIAGWMLLVERIPDY